MPVNASPRLVRSGTAEERSAPKLKRPDTLKTPEIERSDFPPAFGELDLGGIQNIDGAAVDIDGNRADLARPSTPVGQLVAHRQRIVGIPVGEGRAG
jgi:hypothetical protein